MTTYIGYDLGDGDTCISIYEKQGRSMAIYQAQMPGMNPGAAMPTLLSMDETGQGWVGPITLRDKLCAQTAELDINFKARPSELTDREFSAFKRKVKCFTETLFKTCPTIRAIFDDFTRRRFVVTVGHPSTWSPEDRNLYKSIFEETDCFARSGEFFGRNDGIEVDLMVAPESHAALMNLINAKEKSPGSGKNTCDLTVDDIPPGTYAVVIDFGSSTADVTIIRNNDGHIEIVAAVRGDSRLGARYIDRAIYRTIRDEKLSPDSRNRLLEALKLPVNKNLECTLIFFCRLAKETFFLTEPQDRENNMFPPLPKTPGGFFQLDDEFAADGCGIVEKAVGAPIPELGGKSWRESCREMFATLKSHLEAQGLAPALVILTGGASRMDFVHTFAEETFEGVRVFVDPYPAHCISHGLAYLPYRLEQAETFLKDVRRYIDEGLTRDVATMIPDIAGEIASNMSNQICSIAQNEVFQWKEGRWNTLNDMGRGIKDGAMGFLQSEDAKKLNANSIVHVLDMRMEKLVLDKLNTICNSYGIKMDRRKFKVNNPFIDWLEKLRHIAAGNSWGDSVDKLGMAIGENLTSIAIVVMLVLSPILLPLVESLAMVVVGALSWLVFVVLGYSGPVGWHIIFLVLGFSLIKLISLGWEGLKSSFMQNVKTWNLPLLCRKLVSSTKIEAAIGGQRNSITKAIQSKLGTDEKFKAALVDALVKPISERFMMMAEDLALRIRN